MIPYNKKRHFLSPFLICFRQIITAMMKIKTNGPRNGECIEEERDRKFIEGGILEKNVAKHVQNQHRDANI